MTNALLEAANSFGKYLDRLKKQAGGQLTNLSQQVSPALQQARTTFQPVGNAISQFNPGLQGVVFRNDVVTPLYQKAVSYGQGISNAFQSDIRNIPQKITNAGDFLSGLQTGGKPYEAKTNYFDVNSYKTVNPPTSPTPAYLSGAKFAGNPAYEIASAFATPNPGTSVESAAPMVALAGLKMMRPIGKALPQAGEESLNLLRQAIDSGDQKSAVALYKNLSKEFKLPSFQQLTNEVQGFKEEVIQTVGKEAKNMVNEKYGSYQDIAQKMKNFLSMAGNNQAKEGLRFEEHIPKRIFGVGSDEIATVLGKTENEFMDQLKKEAGAISGGKATTQVVKSFGDKVQKLKSIAGKLNPQFYSVLKEWDNKIGAVTAEATPETLAKIAKQEATTKLKAANRTFEEWRNSYRTETISPTEALNRGIKAVQQSTDDAIKSKLVAQGKDVILIDWRSPENVFKKFGVYDEVYVPLKKGQEATAKVIDAGYQKLNQWHKVLGGKQDSQLKIFNWLDGENVPLNPTEQKVAVEIKDYLKEWADKLGLPVDKRITNYITHIFEPDLAGGKRALPEELTRILDYIRPRGVTDPFLNKRTGALGYKQDLFGALDSYIRRGARKLYLDGPINNAARYADAEGTQAQSYIDRFLKNLQGRPDFFEKLIDQNFLQALPTGVRNRLGPRPIKQLTNTATGTVYRAALGLNLGSALKNLTQGVNTLAEIGPKNTMLGYIKLLKNGTKELIDNGVIDDMLIADYRRTPIKNAVQKMDNILFWMFEVAEKINRGSAYYGAKAQALAKGVPEEKAIEFAKSIVRKTQFAYGRLDTPLALQSSLGRAALQFSTFPIKQAELVGGWIKNKEGRKLATYIASSLALTAAAGDLLGLKYTDMLFKNIVPGMGPIPETAKAAASVGISKVFGQEPNWQDEMDLQNAWKLIVPGGVQLDKTIQGGLADYKGGVYTTKGKLNYPIKTISDKIIAPTLGVYRTSEANKYKAQQNADSQARSQAQSKGATRSGNKIYYFDGETNQSITIDPLIADLESKNGIDAVASRVIRASQQFNPKSSMTVEQAVDIVHEMGANPEVAYSLAQKSEKTASAVARNKAIKILDGYKLQRTQKDKENYMEYLRTKNILTSEILKAIKEIESE